ncbi:hypothetical protein AWZ03_013368 [Drosophila navojoa]|uniref:Uncharacterized protein n=1 Tax=Drosophila navojoa TaxID=7232 RepID=A0A484AX71_DRONA|nr:hypothetical protein AWZ03_013368 [Drosophila navojoa]
MPDKQTRYLQRTYPTLPDAGSTQLRILSGIPDCDYRVRSNLPDEQGTLTLHGIDFYSSGSLATSNGSFTLVYTIDRLTKGCPDVEGGTQLLMEATAHTLFLRSEHAVSKLWYVDDLQKSNKSKALVRTLANMAAGKRIVWQEVRSGNTALELQARNYDLHELNTIEYQVFIGQQLIHQQLLRPGGVYALVIGPASNENHSSSMFELTEPNSMSMLWLIPQYVVMSLGEVMFSVTGLEFSYSQAPPSLKSLLQACWLLTVAFGNVIVVIIAELKFFKSQASEFFLFAGLMFLDMLIFMWFAFYYVSYDEVAAMHQRKLIKKRH